MDLFSNLITEENKRISESWKKAHDKKSTDKIASKVIDAVETNPEEILAS